MNSPASHVRLNPTVRHVLKIAGWIVAALLTCIVLAVLLLSISDWAPLRRPLANFASARLHREVSFDGLEVHVFSRTPSADVTNLSIANPDWLPQGRFAHLDRLHVALNALQLLRFRVVLEQLTAKQLELNLVQDSAERANWQFQSSGSTDSSGARIPPIRRFSLQGGELRLEDQVHSLRFSGQVLANENSESPDARSQMFRLEGKGAFNGEPFSLTFAGDALLNIRIDEPYKFTATIAAGSTHAHLDGSIDKPFDLGLFSANVHATGKSLDALYYLTGLALPRTPPYDVQFILRRDRTHFEARDIVGGIGNSDIRGTAGVELGGKRPLLTANMQSKSLRMRDLGVAFGAAAEAEPSPWLLPREPFDLKRLGQMDANVDFSADYIQTDKIPLQTVALGVQLQDGILKLDPAVLTLPQGKLSGSARLDGRVQPAAVALDMRLTGIQLEQFKKKGSTDAPLKGVVQSHATLEGRGNSLHDVAASGNGRLTMVLPHGEIHEVLAELTGINVLRGLGLLLRGDDKSAAIRCGVAEFHVDKGVAQSDRIVFDTEKVVVDGSGRIEFGDETLHLDFSGKPKSFRLLRLRTPINLRGTLAKPSVGIETGHALVQGGAAAALAALTPLAAALAFVDPGLAKDENCAALIAETRERKP